MKYSLLFYFFILWLEFGENFFFYPEKKAILLCLKVCPLYCWKRQKRSAEVYWDHDTPYFWPSVYYEEDHPHPHPIGRWVYCKYPTTPKPTTTMAPTTTEEPTWICEVCMKKCGIPKS